jgi:site-specific recombinase XerD
MNSEQAKELCRRLAAAEMSGKRLKGKTRDAVRDAQEAFFLWLGGRDIRDMRKADLRGYHRVLCRTRSKLTGEPLNPVTVNNRFHSVCLCFSLLCRAGVIQENPARNLRLSLPEPKGIRRRPLTREEINTFLESIHTGSACGLRDRTLFELMYSSGLRGLEAARLKVGDISFESREMTVRGKGDRDRRAPFSVLARDFLLLWLGERARDGEEWVFPGRRGHIARYTISSRFRDLLRRFDMDRKEICVHSIRHSTATHLLENGASVRHVQELLGHRSIETTVRYTHLETDGLAKIYRRHHPREHDLFEAVDEEYEKRIGRILEKAQQC